MFNTTDENDIVYSSEYIENEEADSEEYSFDNYRTNIVTTMAYLLGVKEDTLEDEKFFFDTDTYEQLKKNKTALTVRNLCKLRTEIFRGYTAIVENKKNLIPLDSMHDVVDTAAIKYLRENGMEVGSIGMSDVTFNVAYINQFIQDNVDKIKNLFPEWIKFSYIRALFLMPNAYSGHGGCNLRGDTSRNKVKKAIHEARGDYLPNRKKYPYQMYISWPRPFGENHGNVLFNDAKFLKLLYAANGDFFGSTEYVIDAKEETKEDIYDFVDEAKNVAVFVDCENVDPYCFLATLKGLDEQNLSKIKKIVLYDDVNTSTAWDYIRNEVNIPIEQYEIMRVLDGKSLVDGSMIAGVCEAYYKHDIESIVLASSDSDFWSLIMQLRDARFLVLNERRKTSHTIIEMLDSRGVRHCFMDDFARDKAQEFKMAVLFKGLASKIRGFNETGDFGSLDVEEIITELFQDANATGFGNQVEEEKEAFFNRYMKNGFILRPVKDSDGRLVLKLEFNKK